MQIHWLHWPQGGLTTSLEHRCKTLQKWARGNMSCQSYNSYFGWQLFGGPVQSAVFDLLKT